MKKLLSLLIISLIIVFSCGVAWADEIKATFAGKDILKTRELVAPLKRINTIYGWGVGRVVIECNAPQVVPIGKGTSMLPMVTEGHLVLITTQFEASDIHVGDFVVVENIIGRYFHQVVGIEENKFITRGINSLKSDFFPVSLSEIVGIAIAVIW